MREIFPASDRFKVTYMMLWGALLGSCRHHGFIPWDDEVDFSVDYKRKKDMEKVVAHMGKNFKLWTSHGVRYKVTNRAKSWKTHQAWSWPFLDINFYKQSKTHIYDSYNTWERYKKSDVFPLILRPFEVSECRGIGVAMLLFA